MNRLLGCAAVAAIVLATSLPRGAETFTEEDPFFRRVRRAVTAENDVALYELAREDPWAFRAVTHHLADLAVQQVGERDVSEMDGYARLVIAGHLAAIHLQVTGDASLAKRVRGMRDWKPDDMRAKAAVDRLLAQAESDDPPRPRELEKKLGVCERLEDQRCVGLLQGALGTLLQQAGQPEAAALRFERAAGALRAAGELPLLRDALLLQGQILLEAGDAEAAAGPLGAAAAVAEQLEDAAARTGALLLLAEALQAAGLQERAYVVLGEARQRAFDANLPLLGARAILMRTRLRDPLGELAASAEEYEAAARLAEKGNDLVLVSEAYSAAAGVHAASGRTARGIEAMEKAIAAARLADLEERLGGMLLLSADLHARLDDWTRAVNRLQEARRLFAARGEVSAQARAAQQLGATLLEAGRVDEALEPLQEAVSLARQGGLTTVEGQAEGGLGAVFLARGDSERARRHYLRSAELLERGGARFDALRMRQLAENLGPEQRP